MSMITNLIDRLRKEKSYKTAQKLIDESADAIEMLSEKLRSLQMELSIQRHNAGWIPCEDKLPEIGANGFSDDVLVCFDNKHDDECVDICYYHIDHWIVASTAEQTENVVAWMPLPERYKKEGE